MSTTSNKDEETISVRFPGNPRKGNVRSTHRSVGTTGTSTSSGTGKVTSRDRNRDMKRKRKRPRPRTFGFSDKEEASSTTSSSSSSNANANLSKGSLQDGTTSSWATTYSYTNYGNGNDDQVQTSNQNPSYSDMSSIVNNPGYGGPNGFTAVYTRALCLSLFLWAVYLILPRGFRQFMFNAYPKRYARSSPDRRIQVLDMGKNGNVQRRDSPRRVMRKHLLRGRRNGNGNSHGGSQSGSSVQGYSTSSTTPESAIQFPNNHNHANGNSFRQRTNTKTNTNTNMDDRVDSGITSSRRNLIAVGSTDTDTSDPWDTTNKSFRNIPVNRNSSSVISPFQNTTETEEETVDFLTPTPNMGTHTHIHTHTKFPPTPPSLAELESLASFSHASPSPEKGIVQDPSPVHPNIYTNHRVPSHMVLSSTLTSLREPGVRLHAHGTQCEPRRIWIQLEVNQELLEWRTEQSTSTSTSTSTGDHPNSSFTMGPKHEISLRDILYVDVGKTTAALQLLSEEVIRSDMCFSILTKNGSLDLHAGNKLERDALISCMCLILDTVHADVNGNGAGAGTGAGVDGNVNVNVKSWRDLHISESSVTSRSTGTTRTLERPSSRNSGGTSTANSSGYYGGGSSIGNSMGFSARSDARTAESDVFEGIEPISEHPNESGLSEF